MAEQAWSRGAVKPRNLSFRAFHPQPAGTDRWVPLPTAGSFESVQEAARLYSARNGCRVIVIALAVEVASPVGLTEKALLRMGQPWY